MALVLTITLVVVLVAVSGVNYSFRLTTTISPDQRQLLFRRRGAPRAGRSPPAPVFLF